MIRSGIKRKAPLRRKKGKDVPAGSISCPRTTRPQVKRRKEELARRRIVKAELLIECPRDQAGRPLCPKCLSRGDFRGLQLVHKIPLSGGGTTDRKNCCIRCGPCHFGHGEPWSHHTEGPWPEDNHSLDKG